MVFQPRKGYSSTQIYMNIPKIIRKTNNHSVPLRHYFLWRNAPSRSAIRRKFLFYIQLQPSTFIKIRSWKWRPIQLNPRLHITSLSHQRALFKPHWNILYVFRFQNKICSQQASGAVTVPAWSHAEVQGTWRWGVGFILHLLCPWTQTQGWREQ